MITTLFPFSAPRRLVAWCLFLTFTLASTAVPADADAAETTAPQLNVLFIASDDLNTNLGCYGHPMVKTPNLDRLAARGVRFENAQCNYPLCNPSRTSLLSGIRPERTRVFDNTTNPRAHLKDVVFLPEYFKRHGYYTVRAGKIAHGQFERAVAWDTVINPSALRAKGNADDEPSTESATAEESPDPGKQDGKRAAKKAARKADKAGQADQADAADEGDDDGGKSDGGKAPLGARPTRKPEGQESDSLTAQAIIKQMEKAKDAREPFFLAAGFHRPHTPYSVPQKYFDMYPLSSITLPEEPADDRKDIPALSLRRNRPDPNLTPDERRQAIRGYYASISFVDVQAGLLLDALDRLELTSRTVVIFFGDHGQHLGEHGGLYRKTSLFEQSARSPLIIAGPGAAAGKSSPRPVQFIDFFPTLTELCGLPPNPAAEGHSLKPLLADPAAPWPHAAVTTLVWDGHHGHTLRTERYRYSEWDGGRQGRELFDHQTDPNEYTNLANDPAHAETVKSLHEEIVRSVGTGGPSGEGKATGREGRRRKK